MTLILLIFICCIILLGIIEHLKEKKEKEEIDFIKSEAREYFLKSYVYLKNIVKKHTKEDRINKLLKELEEERKKKITDLKKMCPKRPFMIDCYMNDQLDYIFLMVKL